ncbi:nuclear protein, partial [Lophiotrema nucula]
GKRTRIALACVRCRARKQKCDGTEDTCSRCRRLNLRCQYKAHPQPRSDQKRIYIASLEEHIAALESLL